jgi:hypothetical protein
MSRLNLTLLPPNNLKTKCFHMLALKTVKVHPEMGTHFLVGMPSEIHS